MNVRHPWGVLHSFSIKNIFYDTMDLWLFYFRVTFQHFTIPSQCSRQTARENRKFTSNLFPRNVLKFCM